MAAWKAERRGQGAGALDYLVCAQSGSARGRPLDRRNARARFISACAVLGSERKAMLTIHNGRHTCADLWMTSLYSHVVVDDLTPPNPFAFAAGHSAMTTTGLNMSRSAQTWPPLAATDGALRT